MKVELIHVHDNTVKNMEWLIKQVAHVSYKKEGDLSEAASANFIQKHVLNAGHTSLLRHVWHTLTIDKNSGYKDINFPDYIRHFIFKKPRIDVGNTFFVSCNLQTFMHMRDYSIEKLGYSKIPAALKTIAPTVFSDEYETFDSYSEPIPKDDYAYTFIVEGCSRIFCNQQVRHSHGWAYNQESTRYVNYSNGFDMVIPESIKSKYSENFVKRRIKMAKNSYDMFLEMGIKREDARFFLPLGMTSKIAITVRHEALMGSYKYQRAEGKTGKPSNEIQAVAREMIKQVNAVHGDLE